MSGVVYCGCGHTLDQHVRAGVCRHVNPSSKRFPTPAPCGCRRFHPNPKLLDADDFIGKVLSKLCGKEKLSFEPAEREDLLQVMRISLWRAAEKYDSRSHIPFGSYAAFEIYNDAFDEIRSSRMWGRETQHRLPPPAPSDPDADGNWDFEQRDPHDVLDDDAAGSRRLERAVIGEHTDAEDIGSLSLGWAIEARDRLTDRIVGGIRLQADRPAESGAGSPGWALALEITQASRQQEEAA